MDLARRSLAMPTYAYYHVLTAEAAIEIGVINDKWEEIVPNVATEKAMMAVAMLRHRSSKEAEVFALQSGDDTMASTNKSMDLLLLGQLPPLVGAVGALHELNGATLTCFSSSLRSRTRLIFHRCSSRNKSY